MSPSIDGRRHWSSKLAMRCMEGYYESSCHPCSFHPCSFLHGRKISMGMQHLRRRCRIIIPTKDPHRIKVVRYSRSDSRAGSGDAPSVSNTADLDHSHGARRTLWLAENVVMEPHDVIFFPKKNRVWPFLILIFQASGLASSVRPQTYTSLFDSGSQPLHTHPSSLRIASMK